MKKELLSVQSPGEGEGWYRVGTNASRIILTNEGHGPMGMYDLIYVYKEGATSPFAALPAHQCGMWEYKL